MTVGKLKLTPGERFEISRMRSGLTQAQAAAVLGEPAYKIGKWERGELSDVPATPVRRLSEGEWCYLMRKRAGLTLKALSPLVSQTPVWIHRAEKGLVDCTPLSDWWRERDDSEAG